MSSHFLYNNSLWICLIVKLQFKSNDQVFHRNNQKRQSNKSTINPAKDQEPLSSPGYARSLPHHLKKLIYTAHDLTPLKSNNMQHFPVTSPPPFPADQAPLIPYIIRSFLFPSILHLPAEWSNTLTFPLFPFEWTKSTPKRKSNFFPLLPGSKT